MKRLFSIFFIFYFFCTCGNTSMQGDGAKATGSGDYRGNHNDDYASKDTISGTPMYDAGTIQEKEHEFIFTSSAVGKDYIYIVDTSSDAIVALNVADLSIEAVEVGDAPTIVSTFENKDIAVVLNSGSNTASLIKKSKNEFDVKYFDTIEGANTIKLSPDGLYGVVYFTHKEGDMNLSSLQAVNILRAGEGQEKIVKIGTGFKPLNVFFGKNSARIFIITEDGINILKIPEVMDNPQFSPPVPVLEDPLLKAYGLEILITPDSLYAITRVYSQPVVTILNLYSGKLTTINTQGIATDVDLIPGEKTKVILTYRDENKIEIINIEEYLHPLEEGKPADAVKVISMEKNKSGLCEITPDGTKAIFYSTQNIKYIGMLDLTSDNSQIKWILVKKTVKGIKIDPNSQYAVIYHDKAPGTPLPTDDLDTQIEKSYGYSVLQIEENFVLPFITANEPKDMVFKSFKDKEKEFLQMFIIIPDPKGLSHEVNMVDFTQFQAVKFPVSARPLSIQSIPSTAEVVLLEEHSSGRITFINGENLQTESLTGFQLNSLIE